jgi:dihydroflavonol-4-reductase
MIYITGATGHIGNNLIRKFHQEMVDYRILARKISNSIEPFKDKVILGDVFSYDFLNQNLKENDTLIHLAAYINLKNDKEDLTAKINFEGVKMIADFCLEKSIYLIYTSSTDCITNSEYNLAEPDEIYLESLEGYYQKSKARATNYLLKLSKEQNLKCMIIYPSAVIGINDFKPSAVGKEIKRCFKRKVCFYFHGGYNFVDVENVALAIYNGMSYNITGSYILSGEYISLYKMYKLIFTNLNRKVLMIKIPVYLVKLMTKLLPKYKIMINALLTEHNFSNKKMVNILKVDPTPIPITLKNTIEWFKQPVTMSRDK